MIKKNINIGIWVILALALLGIRSKPKCEVLPNPSVNKSACKGWCHIVKQQYMLAFNS